RPVVAVAGILIVAGPVVVLTVRRAVVLAAVLVLLVVLPFILGGRVLVLVLVGIRTLIRTSGPIGAAGATVAAVVAARRCSRFGLRSGRLVRVLRLGLVGQLTASGELLDLLTLERLLHVVGPDLHREGSTGDLSASAVGSDRDFLAVDLAVEDDGGREIRGVAGEPGGLVLVRGTGLARSGAAEVLGVASRTAVDDLLQSVRGLGGNGLV